MYKILEPIKIGNVEIKNRIMYLAMDKSLSTEDLFISDREIAHYEMMAKNGVGLMATGACRVFKDYPSVLPCQPGLYDDKFIPGIQKLADAVHKYGSKILLQPWHPGVEAYDCSPEEVKGPDDFTKDEIHEIQNCFVEAIVRAKNAGVDGCEWHMAHNYLAEEFCVPLFNHREDEYGTKTIEDSVRFSTEILKEARKKVGEDFLLTVKINGSDMGFEGGMTPDRCAAICVELEKAGAQMISVSAGGGHTDITGMSADGFREEGWKIPLAEAVKKQVSIPVMATGSIRHLDIMEKAILDEKCDMIGMARGLFAEPEFVKKVEENRLGDIRPCISCMNCFSPPDSHEDSMCSVNPTATCEITSETFEEDGNGRIVAVIGAGPAGCVAAINLYRRGYKPVVFEKSGKIGGQIQYAKKPIGKNKFDWYLTYLQTQLEKLKIEVRLNTVATSEMIRNLAPYAVIVAAGSEEAYPSRIEGIDGKNVITNQNILKLLPPVHDKKIVVIGGGLSGLETAHTFEVSGNKVTVIEMRSEEELMQELVYVLAYMRTVDNCDLKFRHKLIKITESSVVVQSDAGEEAIPADMVILAMGRKSENDLYDSLSKQFDNVVKIGDTSAIGNIRTATNNAYRTVLQMK